MMETLFVMRNGEPVPAEKEYKIISTDNINRFNKERRERLISKFLKQNIPGWNVHTDINVNEISPQNFRISARGFSDLVSFSFEQQKITNYVHLANVPTSLSGDSNYLIERARLQMQFTTAFGKKEERNHLELQLHETYLHEIMEHINKQQ